MFRLTARTALRFGFHQIKSARQFAQLSKKHPNYVLDFTASWCGPCKIAKPILKKKEQQSNGKWTLFLVDIDVPENQDLAADFGVESIPAMFFYKDGKKLEKVVGVPPNFDTIVSDLVKKF